MTTCSPLKRQRTQKNKPPNPPNPPQPRSMHKFVPRTRTPMGPPSLGFAPLTGGARVGRRVPGLGGCGGLYQTAPRGTTHVVQSVLVLFA